jgi:hypothetical protein
MRVSRDNGVTWNDEFYDLTGDVSHIFTEAVFPAMAAGTDDYLHVIYQDDTEPGGAVQGDNDPYGDNYYPYIKIHKPEILGVLEYGQFTAQYLDFASPCYPNPVRDNARINVHLLNPARLSIEVFSLTGEKVMELNKGYKAVGVHQIVFDVSHLARGAYMYKVKAENESISNRMIVY